MTMLNPATGDPFVVHQSCLSDRIAAKCAQRLGPPIGHAELFLTEGCNQRCDYCFVREKDDLRSMPEAVARAAVDFLIAQARRGTRSEIMFFGGEPLLRFPMLASLVDYACHQASTCGVSSKLSFSVTTNGTLITEEMARFFQEHRISYLLSIDGDRATHDAHRKTVTGESSYDLLLERLPMMKAFQPWQGARVTVHPEHADRLRHNVEHLARLGINQFIIGPATGVPWSDEALKSYEASLLDALKWVHGMIASGAPLRMWVLEEDVDAPPGKYRNQWGCGAGRGRMSVDVDGNIYPCSKIYGVASARRDWLLGNVWGGITEYRRRALFLDDSDRLRTKCRSCGVRDDCAGGCPAHNIEATGDQMHPSELDCAMTRMMIRIRRKLAAYRRRHSEPRSVPTLHHVRPLS